MTPYLHNQKEGHEEGGRNRKRRDWNEAQKALLRSWWSHENTGSLVEKETTRASISSQVTQVECFLALVCKEIWEKNFCTFVLFKHS